MALISTLLCPALRAAADDSQGPQVVGTTESLPAFHLEMPTGYLSADYLNEHDVNKQTGTPTTGATTNYGQETLSLLSNAYILSPNLDDIKLGGTFGLQQESFEGPGTHQYTKGELYGWDVASTFLRNEDAPLTLYTRRNTQLTTPDFSQPLISTDTTSGGDLNLRSDIAPTEFQLYQETDNQQQLNGVNNYNLLEDVARWHTDVLSLRNQTLSWDYTYQNVYENEQGAPTTHYENHEATLTHVLYLNPDKLSSLTSSINENDQIGDLPFQQFRLDEYLRLQNTPDLQTHVDYNLDQSEISGINELDNQIDAGFVHHLFASLITSGDVGGSILQATGSGDVEEAFSKIDFDYHKVVPGGLFTANLDLGWQWQYAAQGTGAIPIINQSQTFNNAQPIVLTQPNIDPTSIKVLSSSGVPYLQGTDYKINTLGNLIQIQRVLGGLIPFDGSVLLDYNLLPQAANTTNTGSAGVGGRYEFQKGFLTGLAPYARLGIQRQQIDTEDPSQFIPNSFTDTVVGADYRVWRLTFNVEQEWHDSPLIPFDSTRFSARYDDRLSADVNASFSGFYSLTNYYSEFDYVKDASLSAEIDQQLNQEWSVEARAIYLNDQDQVFGNSEGLQEQLELRWKHNLIDAYARVTNATLRDSGVTTDFQIYEIGASRKF
jgi:hypothetical protein